MDTQPYEWISGPRLTAEPERTEFHALRGRLEPRGKIIGLLVGQVRDTRLAILINWARRAPTHPVNARLALSELRQALPRASDWSPSIKRRTCEIPKGWTIPNSDAEFVQGLMI